jgi:flavin-dependent dehydrogenase
MNKLEKISVVGGGTAGFTAALILKTRFPHLQVEVIRSKKIGIIGVGEGSTEHWNEFMKYINVPFQTVIRHCDATFKCGIMFKGWGKQDYLHSIGPENDIKNGQYPTVYGKLLSSRAPNHMLNPSLVWENKVYAKHLEPDSGSPFNQYHFNTNKLNDFLTKIAEIRGIDVIDDEILDVQLSNAGDIKQLVGEHNTYSSDFYIDCTGFKKLLISKLGATWQSHSKYLKMKSAIVFPTEEKEEYNMWTTAQAMDYGWMFNIPVWGRCGNGYIFDSDYINAEQAQAEVEKFLGHEVTVGKHINFDPGHLDRVWIKNCCAIGLSANFIEPLEATSIGTSIQQAFLLMHRLPNYTEKTIEKYNKDVNDIMTNIRDFVILHYITNKTNTQFWKDVSQIELPDSLKENLEKWRTNLPIADDFNSQTAYVLFRDAHYLQVLAGLGLFDREKIKQEYDMMHHDIKNIAENFIRETRTLEKMNPTVSHKEFISVIRNKNIR